LDTRSSQGARLMTNNSTITAQPMHTGYSGCAVHVMLAKRIEGKHSSAAKRDAYHVQCKLDLTHIYDCKECTVQFKCGSSASQAARAMHQVTPMARACVT